MLVLTLRVNETITLGNDVEVMVTGISVGGMKLRGGQVKLGVRAPRQLRVHRGRHEAPPSRKRG